MCCGDTVEQVFELDLHSLVSFIRSLLRIFRRALCSGYLTHLPFDSWSPPLLFNAIALGLILFRNVELSKQAGRVPILQRMLRE